MGKGNSTWGSVRTQRWAWGGGGEEVEEGGGTRVVMADSHCCMAEANTIL